MKILSTERDYRLVVKANYKSTPGLENTHLGPWFILGWSRAIIVIALVQLMDLLTGYLTNKYVVGLLILIVACGMLYYLYKVKKVPQNYLDNPEYFEQESTPLWLFITVFIVTIILTLPIAYYHRHYFREHGLLYYVFTAGVDKIRYLP